mgnify:CR=1 FL=1
MTFVERLDKIKAMSINRKSVSDELIGWCARHIKALGMSAIGLLLIGIASALLLILTPGCVGTHARYNTATHEATVSRLAILQRTDAALNVTTNGWSVGYNGTPDSATIQAVVEGAVKGALGGVGK